MPPMFQQLALYLPARVRRAIYVVFGTAIGVESTLDLFDYGLVAEKPMAAAIAVMATLGFGMAAVKSAD